MLKTNDEIDYLDLKNVINANIIKIIVKIIKFLQLF